MSFALCWYCPSSVFVARAAEEQVLWALSSVSACEISSRQADFEGTCSRHNLAWVERLSSQLGVIFFVKEVLGNDSKLK